MTAQHETKTDTESNSDAARALLNALGYSGPAQAGRVERLAAVLAEHPKAELHECADEKTGRRFGQAACRAGRCAKIGSTGYSYQLWAVWPAA